MPHVAEPELAGDHRRRAADGGGQRRRPSPRRSRAGRRRRCTPASPASPPVAVEGGHVGRGPRRGRGRSRGAGRRPRTPAAPGRPPARTGRSPRPRCTGCRAACPARTRCGSAARPPMPPVCRAQAALRCSWATLVAAYTLRGSSGASSSTSAGRQWRAAARAGRLEPAGGEVGDRARRRGGPGRARGRCRRPRRRRPSSWPAPAGARRRGPSRRAARRCRGRCSRRTRAGRRGRRPCRPSRPGAPRRRRRAARRPTAARSRTSARSTGTPCDGRPAAAGGGRPGGRRRGRVTSVAGREQGGGHVGADEAGAAGHEYVGHGADRRRRRAAAPGR